MIFGFGKQFRGLSLCSGAQKIDKDKILVHLSYQSA